MYAIFSGGELLSFCDSPRYVRLNPNSGAYIQATKEDAEGIAVNSKLYNLPGSTTIPDAPEAMISKEDVSEYVFRNNARISLNEEASRTAFIEMENALCEQDTINDERMTTMEEALCDLDIAINGGDTL